MSLFMIAWRSLRQRWLASSLTAFSMALGVALTIVGAAVQALELGAFHFIWQFDHNSAYHLIQVLGLAVIIWGLRAGFRHASEIR